MALNIERLRHALAIPKRDFQHVTGVTGVTSGIFGVTGRVTGAAEHVTDATASGDEGQVTHSGNVGLRIPVTCEVIEVTRVTPVTYKNTGFGDCVSEDSTVGPPARLKIIPRPDEPPRVEWWAAPVFGWPDRLIISSMVRDETYEIDLSE